MNVVSVEQGGTACLFRCRAGYESALEDEIRWRWGSPSQSRFRCESSHAGTLLLFGEDTVFPPRLLFERQRMEMPVAIPAGSIKTISRDILIRLLPSISRSSAEWTAHFFSEDGSAPHESLADRLNQAFCGLVADRFTRVWRRYRPPSKLPYADALVLQVMITDTIHWGCVMPVSRMPDRHPGGIHRMAFDPLAPSRSYLKMEEAFDVLNRSPAPGQTVVDLGAAPGGWTYACYKRGCIVYAVDRGTMRLPARRHVPGRVIHVREDGISYCPRQQSLPVDWLISDMLIPAGMNLVMIRKWMEHRWMKNFIVNIKIPQIHPIPALQPFLAYLASVPGLEYQVRHLYHDRREVTVMGRLLSQR